jgi:hypothetical protein
LKKAAILTLNGYFNYGNRLQNYATQEILKNLGFSVETLVVETVATKKQITKKSLKKRVINILKSRNTLKRIQHKTWKIKNKKTLKELENYRTEKFKLFTSNLINESEDVYRESNIPSNISDQYDCFIVGSDQVWNPIYNNESSLYFLRFVQKNKRIALSPSFGISKLSEESQVKYKKWLKEIPNLSVREEAGQKIIYSLIGQTVPVLVDPTLMLSKDKWLSVSEKALNKPEKYLLTYFLGGIDTENSRKISKIAKKNNLDIINLADITHRDAYKTGPSEFIDYINDAEIFCTDSFHGTVFAILMKTPFIVYDRKSEFGSMYSRIDTLLEKFSLSNRKSVNIIEENEVFNIDFSHVESILKFEREKFLSYLSNALQR